MTESEYIRNTSDIVKNLLFTYRNDEDKFKTVYIKLYIWETDFDYRSTSILADVFWANKDNLIKNLLRKEKLKNILDK